MKSPNSRNFNSGGQGEWSETTISIRPSLSAAQSSSRFSRSRIGGQHLNSRTAKDRKSTRLNSSHLGISYAVFCLKKKKKKKKTQDTRQVSKNKTTSPQLVYPRV